MKYYLIAGEASGDLHGANLMKAIKHIDPQAGFRFWGGDLMTAEGGVNVSHIRDRAIMGFWEVIKSLGKLKQLISLAKKDILEYQPDRLIFIDYPGFNLRMAEWAHGLGMKTHYYISPKVWAWNTKRALRIKKIIDYLYVIFPFETDFYDKYGYKAIYVGNPLMDAMESYQKNRSVENVLPDTDKPVLAILPGSRQQEIHAILPLMLKSLEHIRKDYQPVLAVAPDFDTGYFRDFPETKDLPMLKGKTYDLLAMSSAAMVTSGTATLETALFEVPQVVCYKTGKFNYLLGKQLIRVKFISLVNLIAGKEIVKELIQDDLTPESIAAEINSFELPGKREAIQADYRELKAVIGPAGASERVAQSVFKQA